MNNLSSTESSSFQLQMAFDMNSEQRFRNTKTLAFYGAVSRSASKACVTKLTLYDVCRASDMKTRAIKNEMI